MTRRLIDETRDTFVRTLLRSAQLDAAPRGSLGRTAAAIGISSVAMVGTTTLGVGVHASGITTTTSKAMLSLVLKGLVVGGTAGTILLGGGVWFSEFAQRSPARNGEVAGLASGNGRQTGLSPSASAEPEVTGDQAAEPARAKAMPQQRVGPNPSARAGTGMAAFDDRSRSSHLAAEIAAIDRVRTLVRTGRSEEALLELDRYERSSPSRELATEAALLRVEALVATDRRSEAAALARRLLQSLRSRESGAYVPHERYLETVAAGH